MIVQIYKLYDPRDPDVIRYIGRTSKQNLSTRLVEHLSKAKYRYGRKSHVINWIAKLLKENVIPVIEKIDEIEGWKESHTKEREYIKKYLELKHPLTNLEDKGEGSMHFVSEETKIQISKTLSNKLLGKDLYNTKPVFVFNRLNILINQFNSCANCARYYNIPLSKISEIARGNTALKSYNEMKFSFDKELKEENKFIFYILENIKTNKAKLYCSLGDMNKKLNLSIEYLSRVKNKQKIVLQEYKIWDSKNPQALIKFCELLENPNFEIEMDNQQPSLDSNISEGSTTNSGILLININDIKFRDSNADTSAGLV